MDLSLLKSKFRGTMLGVLVGDCLGSPYEGLSRTLPIYKRRILQNRVTQLWEIKCREPVMKYTDDSAMTRSVAESLIDKQDLDIVDIAKQLAKSYYQQPDRGYGAGAINVLQKLHIEEKDIKAPAKDLFNGTGSYGNGGAMRVASIALFSYNNYDNLLHFVKEATLLTHAHKLGINGAILQAIAIHQSLWLNPSEELNVFNFVDNLISKLDKIDESQLYKEKLHKVKNLLSEDDYDSNVQKVVEELGVNINALESVPTAIFCFLRAQKVIKGIRTNNPVRRAIQYAITLGGDTDTIASMTGALAGAFYGYEKFSILLLSHCEEWDKFRELADNLFDVATY